MLMRCGPVDTLALRAERKLFLRGENIRRDSILDFLLGYRNQGGIALDTAGKRLLPGIQVAGMNHLLELLTELVALDQKIVGGISFCEIGRASCRERVEFSVV